MVATALIATACAPFVSTGGEGAIQIFFGTPTGSRALSDPPFTELPVFSAITIKVSGSGMEPVEFTVDASQTSFTAMVPGGSDRRIELYAPVDWDATDSMLATIYGAGIPPQPTLVKAYGATTTLNVVPGQRVTAVLRLEVAETKILLPDAYNSSQLYIADDLHSVPYLADAALDAYSGIDYEFDRYGRFIYSAGSVFYAVNVNAGNPVSLGLQGSNLAYDKSRDWLYSWYDDDGTAFYGYSFVETSPSPFEISGPSGYGYSSGSVAVDAAGFVYIPVYQNETELEGIAKVSIDAPSGGYAASQVIIFSSLDSLGLAPPLDIRDMTVKDGKLYVLAGENDSYLGIHHGKVVEIDLATLTRNRELGWTNSDTPTSPSTQFYGPQRFIALAPRKLIFADEGYDGTSNVDRVVEVDLDSWSISAIGLEGAVSFFNDYMYAY